MMIGHFLASLGLVLTGLSLWVTPMMAAPSGQIAEGEVYVVQAEDWLSKIAEKYYSDVLAYPLIVQATNAKAGEDATFAVITNPDVIEIGQKLWIPTRDGLVASTPRLDASIPILAQVAEIGLPADTLAFSPDDKLLALEGWEENGERFIQGWDTASWSLRWEKRNARYLAFSPSGQHLITVISDTACLCDPATGQPVVQLQYDGAVSRVIFSADGQRLAGIGPEGKVILWEAASGQPITEFKHELSIADFVLSPHGPWLAVMTSGSWGPVELVVWDIFSHERRTLAQLNGLPNQSNVVFSPDTNWLAATVGYEAPVTIWQTQTWPEVAHLDRPPGFLMKLAFSPNSRWLTGVVFNGETNNKILIWEAPSWQVVAQMDMADVVQTVVFSPDSQWLAAGLGQGIEHPPAYEAQLWEVATGRLVARMPHQNQVQAVAFSHNGHWIATGSVDRTVKVWALPEDK